ncbi:Glycerol-3-phosphate acyltransferase protein [Thalictrum thalictroides]|uniref:Glycerol-3-phosphate acyltransferase, chloroplastic n=1 Tax=Thalictrum thalictroides TaxID=46969 RepID=A0A7J6WAF0_THATH|nr:Glycerol-3-phosphate acyltransferase protein [Thalictrum thalictroides]
MSIISTSSSVSSFIKSRVSHRTGLSTSTSLKVSSLSSSRTCCPCASVSFKSKVRSMAELVEDKKSVNKNTRADVELSLDSEDDNKFNGGHSRTFLDAQTEQELLSGINKEIDAGKLPLSVAAGLEELYKSYRNAVVQSGNPRADEITLTNMAATFDRILWDVEDPFTFSSYHKAIREPFDYYVFGQNYIRPLINFRKSYVGNISVFGDMEDKLRQGHNVILISNHQTEADPAVIALLLEKTSPHIAENVTYIAGDRVVADPLCKPFSMGRNLICVYSKKHMNDIPELAEMKRRANTRSLKEMAMLLRSGSQIIWIAPSGGRDRPDPSTGEWFPAPFDDSSVDNIRRLADHSGVPRHIYPLTLMCHDIMPPPPQVEKEIGEKRVISFHGVGLSVAPEINFNEIASMHENPEEVKVEFSRALYNSVTEQYNVLKSAILENQGLKASISSVSLSQPWQ